MLRYKNNLPVDHQMFTMYLRRSKMDHIVTMPPLIRRHRRYEDEHIFNIGDYFSLTNRPISPQLPDDTLIERLDYL
jgi:hypothetical protein